MTWLGRQRDRLRDLVKRLREEHASPREIGQAVAVGVFVGCSPALGFHGAVALGSAILLQRNKIWTWLGSRISNILVLPWIVMAEIEISHRLRTGAWVSLSADTVLERAPFLLVDWIFGAIPVGAVLGAVFGALAYAIAKWRVTRARRLAPPRPPTSESPPSGSPAPPS